MFYGKIKLGVCKTVSFMKKLFSLYFCFKNNRSLALPFKKKEKEKRKKKGNGKKDKK